MPRYPTNTSLRADALVTLRQQMADFARAERLRDLRDARHLSQEDAAHEIGVSVKSLRAWEKGGGIRWENALLLKARTGGRAISALKALTEALPTCSGNRNQTRQRSE
jgi:transcriptional regulator with XRE-family HTH domain